MESQQRTRATTDSPVLGLCGDDLKESTLRAKRLRARTALAAAASVRRAPTEGRAAVLNRQTLAELFNCMREAADVDPAQMPAHSRLLPFSHLQVPSMGGLHKLRAPGMERLRNPPVHKYLAVVVQMAVLVLNLSLLLQSLRCAASTLLGLGSAQDENGSAGHIQVGFLSAANRHQLAALFEGAGLLYYIGRLAIAIAQTRARADAGLAGLRRWSAHATIFWELLPALRTFSALRMLRRVHPQLLPAELNTLVKTLRRERAPSSKKLLKLLTFCGHRLVILYCGFQAFVYKFTSTAARLKAGEGSPVLQLLVSFAFLNQLLGGVVQLEKLMTNRLLLFLFGGEDAHIDAEEAALLRVWTACLARTLHREAAAGEGCWSGLRSSVAISGFNHMDLQQVVLMEDQEEVAKRHLLIRLFSRRGAGEGKNGLGGQEENWDLEEHTLLQDLLEGSSDPALPDSHVLMRGD